MGYHAECGRCSSNDTSLRRSPKNFVPPLDLRPPPLRSRRTNLHSSGLVTLRNLADLEQRMGACGWVPEI